ncbi:MAG TPA: cytochrome c [Candidatus Angelobacter sp.]|nr:cytochrome c [Candidatus Angelobacter sp.]
MKRILISFLLGVVTPLVALVVLGFMGLLPVRATSKPSGIEAAIADRALMARLAHDAKGMKNPLEPNEATLLAGMKVYRDDCAGCHGGARGESAWGAKNFYPPVPQLVQEGVDLPAPELYLLVKHGVRYTGMAAWEGQISDQEIWQVATFLTRIKSLPPAVQAVWTAPPQQN